jgi:hypothetical protein
MRRLLPLFLLLVGCARPQATQAPTAAASGNLGAGTLTQPIGRCGPRDSYRYVAEGFRCSDGTNPFRGQLEEAARARQGSRKGAQGGHIIDLYQVPCAGGEVTVYVDMYQCPEQEAALERGPDPSLLQAIQALDGGDFPEVVRRCMEVVNRPEVDGSTVECLAITPAAMALSGGETEALKLTGGFCSKLPSNDQQKLRRQHVEQIARWVFRGAKGRISRQEFRALMGRFATACGVNDEQGA